MGYKNGEIIANRWKKLGDLGGGGNSHVYRVHDKNDKTQEFALKAIKIEDLKPTSSKYKRFDIEIQTQYELSQANHPGVLPLLEYSIPQIPRPSDPIWMLMPIAKTADTYFKDSLNVKKALEMTLSIAKTIQSIDKIKPGFVHRDIKPQNIFHLNNSWHLGDFGLITFDDKSKFSKNNERLGSMHFMAPECHNNPPQHSEKSDVYALAKSLYCILCSTQYPVPGHINHLYQQTSVTSYIRHQHSDNIAYLIDRCTIHDFKDRFGLDEMISELKTLINLVSAMKSSSAQKSQDLQSELKKIKTLNHPHKSIEEERKQEEKLIQGWNQSIHQKWNDWFKNEFAEKNTNEFRFNASQHEISQAGFIQLDIHKQRQLDYSRTFENNIQITFEPNKRSLIAGVSITHLSKGKVQITGGILFYRGGRENEFLSSKDMHILRQGFDTRSFEIGSSESQVFVDSILKNVQQSIAGEIGEFQKWDEKTEVVKSHI